MYVKYTTFYISLLFILKKYYTQEKSLQYFPTLNSCLVFRNIVKMNYSQNGIHVVCTMKC